MEQIAANIYVETGYEGVNTGAVLTRQGIIAIDVPSYPRQARDWAMRLHTLTQKPLQHLILTDANGDRILNARWLNAPIIAHEATAVKLMSYDKRYPVSMMESLALRNPNRSRELSNNPVEKPAISFSHKLRILKGEVEILLLSAPGPTWGNLWVFLPQQGVLFAGDTITFNYPPLLADKCSKQWLETLHRLENWPQAIYTIVPGRGPLTSTEAIPPLRHYLELLRARIQTHIQAGRPREKTAVYVPEFMAMFPQNGLPTDWLSRQIACSLAHVYDEIQLEQTRMDKPAA